VRRFVVLGHTQRAEPPLPLNDLPGAGGRWDLLARCVTNALLLSHGVRHDTQVVLTLPAGRSVRVDGAHVRHLNPDERSTAALLSKALEAQDVGHHETPGPPGFFTRRHSLEPLLTEWAAQGPVVALAAGAHPPLHEWVPPAGTMTFLLSDHRPLLTAEADAVRQAAAVTLSLGPLELQADQCIPIVHNHLDRLAHR
jgi:tRNA (pseudouridine54-N1)-methyltransferase